MSYLVVLALLTASCSRPPAAVERLVVLRFDNLSGDASLDWIATAAPAILGSQLAGAGRMLPALGENVRDGYLQRATHLAHGYFDKRGHRRGR
jgi:hypothetical protein